MANESSLQNQTKKYKREYQPEQKKGRVQITVDEDLANIIRAMKRDAFTDKAIRGYAKAFLGLE